MENSEAVNKDMLEADNATKVNIKPIEKQLKHSSLFYISPSLFDNKRLKQRRAKRAAAIQLARANNSTTTKTFLSHCRKTTLEPAVTIDLLSDDDDDDDVETKYKSNDLNNTELSGKKLPLPPLVLQSEPPPLAPIQGVMPQHFLLYPASNLQLATGNSLYPSNIRLIPMSQLSGGKTSTQLCLDPATLSQLSGKMQLQLDAAALAKLTAANNTIFDTTTGQTRIIATTKMCLDNTVPLVNNGNKRKRKARPPKRHSLPPAHIMNNNESIVLTDDSENEIAISSSIPQLSSKPPPLVATTSPLLKPMPMQNGGGISGSISGSSRHIDIKKDTPPSPEKSPMRIAQVDEEVTVSLVPRSSTAGSCSSKAMSNSKLFPMLPDETTVHTVIANRTYELSLTKLREGLGIDGEPTSQQKISPTRRKGNHNIAHGHATTAAGGLNELKSEGPISLKLSSDLSISLISDDDDEDADTVAERVAEKLLQLPPQLAVQEVRMPATISPDGRHVPRRRKLG